MCGPRAWGVTVNVREQGVWSARGRYYGGAGPVGAGPMQRPTYKNTASVMKPTNVTSRTSLLLAALAHRATVTTYE